MGQLQVLAERVRHRLEVVDEREIDVAGAEALLGVLGLGLDHAQFHVRMAVVELGHGARHERGARALEAGEPQAAAAQARQRREIVLRALDAGEDRVGVRDQRPAGVGEPHPARPALEEGGADLTFQRRDLL